MSKNDGLTVLQLEVENVKRLKAIRIDPPRTGTVTIAGKNGAGKSSTLDAILYALGGKGTTPTKPIHEGAKSAKDVVVLQDAQGRKVLRATRTWTTTGTYLTVEAAGEGKIKSPQEFLNALVGAGLGFDPLAFTRLRPAEQVRMLLDLLKLDEDPREIDRQRKDKAEARTLAARDAKRVQAQLAGLPEPPADTPEAEIDTREVVQAHRRLTEQDQAHNQAAATADKAFAELVRAKERLDRAVRELEEATVAETTARSAQVAATGLLTKTPKPDFAEVNRQLAEAEDINAAVRARREWDATATDLHHHEEVVAALDEDLDAIEARKRELLASAPFPVPGLGFAEVNGEWCVTMHGIPLEGAAQSEQIRVSLGIAMALNPRLRVVLIREGSLLDAESRALVNTLAAAQGFQVWLEVVGDGGAGAIVIEDGGVVEAAAVGDGQKFGW